MSEPYFMTDHHKRSIMAAYEEDMWFREGDGEYRSKAKFAKDYEPEFRQMNKRIDDLIRVAKEEAQKAMLDDLLLSGAVIEIDESDGKKTVSITADTVGAGKKIWKSADFREIAGVKDDV